MIVCNKCGTQQPDNNKFCYKCGSKIVFNQAICSKCGKPVTPNSKFCGSCGNPIVQAEEKDSTQVDSAKPLRAIVCELCGGNNLVKENGYFTCQHCGTRYSLEEARKMMIEGTVQVAGTVRVDNSGKVSSYLMMAESALEVNNYMEAEEYANKVIEIEPQNPEAWFIKGKAAGWQSTLGKIRLSESVQCWGNVITYSGDNCAKYQQLIADEMSKLIKGVVLLKVDLFAKSPSNNTANELFHALDLIDLAIRLQEKTQIPAQESFWREYMASCMNTAAIKGFDYANDYFGAQIKDRLTYTGCQTKDGWNPGSSSIQTQS